MKHALGLGLAALLTTGGWTIAQGQDDPLTRPLPTRPEWVAPVAPLKIHGNTYYVGYQGISITLIDTGDGLILVDGGMPQTAEQTKANLRTLGYRIEDVRYLLNTEAHFDHSGGIAALARDSGATVLAAPLGVEALRTGRVHAEDPQASDIHDAPPVPNVRGIENRQGVTLGSVTVTAVHTPGHTPGSSSWTWRSCEGGDCRSVVFASSLNAVAADPFTYAGHPDTVATLRASIDRFAALDCDILISAHPDNSGGDRKLAALAAGAMPNPFIDPAACVAYAERARNGLKSRLEREGS
ncbi:MAG: subclass B3 metallo-beta-lactamase [Brevundimonas sp.]|uniref:subclass B3 metallo-beta-lactamase n=1 Tax=Brevundimonas sp. TaxID=1871086 RepID=UPI0011FC8DE2|nr:subclass B3 metallo-beta-lactamase [Brevundimonas sp.]RZJ17498.1 MAG: subclass B3 metallo-beta-lactamase [Brevundimonas sp.]